MRKILLFITILLLTSLVLIGASCKEDKKISEYTVYTSAEYGFSFEYPKKWYIVDNPEFGTIFLSNKQEEPPMGGQALGARIEIFIIENTENLGPEQEQGHLSKTVYLTGDGYAIQINYTGREPDYTENLKNFEYLVDSFEFE